MSLELAWILDVQNIRTVAQRIDMLVLPERLRRMINDGRWPAWGEPARNTIARRIDAVALRTLVPGETEISFRVPPFWTVAQEIESGSDFWEMPETMVGQIDPQKSVVIAGFGHGSDSVLVLDYRANVWVPAVIRLQWAEVDPESNNKWVAVAPTFKAFCQALGICGHSSKRQTAGSRWPHWPRDHRPRSSRKVHLSRKQRIYMDIMSRILPDARNAQTLPAWRRLIDGNLYVPLELVHNIPPLMAHAKMTRWDIYWLNTQARNYASACEASPSTGCRGILSAIRDLVDMVPSALRSHLQWNGPASSPKLARLLSLPTAVRNQ